MKVIFLDIDGVLNNDIYFHNEKIDLPYPLSEFSPSAVDLLNKLTDSTGAKLVISSDWRKDNTLEGLKNIFSRVGITGEIIGKTPILRGNRLYGETVRGDEINVWLVETHHKIEKYIILDDNNDMCQEQQGNFV